MFNRLARGCEEIIPLETFKERIKQKPLRVKFGADPTSPDIHLGHTVILNKLRVFQEAGHHVVFIIGDTTARIGDPSGRNETRPILTEDEIKRNASTYQEQVFKILEKSQTEVVYNSQWFDSMNLSDVLKLTSSYTVARMLERDDFSLRFKNGIPISIHEFLYPLMQAYDSVMVRADIEVGGTDQKFNLLLGRELQKQAGQIEQIIMTHPLLPGLDGHKKMSKTLNNTIGLTEPPEDTFGKIMSISDEVMFLYYRLLTDIPMKDIEEWERDDSFHRKELKMKLASMITGRFHSKKAALKAGEHFNRVIVSKKEPEEIETLKLSPDNEGDIKLGIIRLVTESGFASSKGAARRLIQQRGVKINNQTIEDVNEMIPLDKPVILRVGKRKYKRVMLK